MLVTYKEGVTGSSPVAPTHDTKIRGPNQAARSRGIQAAPFAVLWDLVTDLTTGGGATFSERTPVLAENNHRELKIHVISMGENIERLCVTYSAMPAHK